MKHSLICFAFFSLPFAIAACGDDGDSATRPSDESSSSVALSLSSSVTPKSSSSNKNVSSSSSNGAINSSSSVKVSSSSKKVELSSSLKNEPSSSAKKVEPESSSSSAVIPGVTGNLLTDSRDGQSYKTVSIGTQTWMAQNLNYETANSFCYSDTPSNCTKYGRLYTWGAAMDSAGTWSSNGKGCGFNKTCSPTYPVRGICPTGWHLPTKSEFEALFTAVGDSSIAGTKLKSTSGWYTRNDGTSGNGTDDYSFSALSAGGWYDDEYYALEGYCASFWSSTEGGNSYVYDMILEYRSGNANLNLNDNYKGHGFSIRCVKD